MLSNEQLVTILNLPIEVIRGKNKKIFIEFGKGRIRSTQKYRGCDPDVSDFAMDFYTAIYGIEELVDVNRLKNTDFCGDTMQSFKMIKRKLMTASTEDSRLQNITHCLANFWVLPMDVGHSSSWTARRGRMHLSKSAKCKDNMNLFLDYYNENYKEYCNYYAQYTSKFEKEKFITDHFLKDIEYGVLESIESVIDMNDRRARNILKEKENEIRRMLNQDGYEFLD